MKLKIITTVEDLEASRSEWNTLLAMSQKNIVPLTCEWVMAWWKAFGNAHQLHIIIVYNENDDIIGIAPFIKLSSLYRNINIKKISLMANGHSPCSGVIARKEDMTEVIHCILDHLTEDQGWDLVEFTKVDNHGPTCVSVLDYVKKKNYLWGIQENIESPYISIISSWEDFFKKKSSRFRKSLRNKINRADKSGDIVIEKISINSSMDPALEDMFRISGNSWKKKIKTDLTSIPESRVFYMDIFDQLGPEGVVSLWFLKKGDHRIAFELHLTYNDVVYPVRADYDESFSQLSPGSVLEFNILKTLFNEAKIKEYNSCGHTYNYLLNWTDETRKHVNIEVFNRNIKARALHFLEYKLIPLMKQMKLNKVVTFLKRGN